MRGCFPLALFQHVVGMVITISRSFSRLALSAYPGPGTLGRNPPYRCPIPR